MSMHSFCLTSFLYKILFLTYETLPLKHFMHYTSRILSPGLLSPSITPHIIPLIHYPPRTLPLPRLPVSLRGQTPPLLISQWGRHRKLSDDCQALQQCGARGLAWRTGGQRARASGGNHRGRGRGSVVPEEFFFK